MKLLDSLPLAVDLAAARIVADIDNGLNAEAAINQFLTDYQQHRDDLLTNADFNQASRYGKTVWTVLVNQSVLFKSFREGTTEDQSYSMLGLGHLFRHGERSR